MTLIVAIVVSYSVGVVTGFILLASLRRMRGIDDER